jgi:hypothetical protein
MNGPLMICSGMSNQEGRTFGARTAMADSSAVVSVELCRREQCSVSDLAAILGRQPGFGSASMSRSSVCRSLREAVDCFHA